MSECMNEQNVGSVQPYVQAGAPGATDAERAAWLADKIGALGDYAKEAAAMLRRWPAGVSTVAPVPSLAVWFGPMPESNGKTNWTAILHRGDMVEGFTIERSEHHDRVRYEADRVRHLIGELADAPDLMAYDPDMLSPPGYVHPCGVAGTLKENGNG